MPDDQPAANQPESPPRPDQLSHSLRWSIYWLIAICSIVVMGARVWQVEKTSYGGKKVPFLSANDRSRWCTIRSLGDHDTYAIDLVLQSENGDTWDTIDKVVHWGRDFQPHSYSSKPTLLPTLLAYPYLALKFTTGLNFTNDTFLVVRLLLLFCQVLPLLLFFWAIGRIADAVAMTEWTRIFLMISACFGTYVTTFAISLNNHVPSVVAIALATAALVEMTRNQSASWIWYGVAGLSSAFAAANELPALAFLVFALFYCMIRDIPKTMLAFLPAAAVVVAAFFITNYRAHGDWRPPYAHRNDGPVVAIVPGDYDSELDDGQLPEVFWDAIVDYRADIQQLLQLSSESSEPFEARVVKGGWPTDEKTAHRWIIYFDAKVAPIVLARRADGIGYEVRQWDNWYEYPDSYWLTDNERKSGIDRGEENRLTYLVNLTFGHHGVFSLSPIWLLSLLGVFGLASSRAYGIRLLGLGILAISIVLIAFYVSRPIEDRNYGGMTCGPRWFFWLIPLWLVAMIPLLDWLSTHRALRLVAMILLVISVASASYAWTNPWVQPWIYEVFYG